MRTSTNPYLAQSVEFLREHLNSSAAFAQVSAGALDYRFMHSLRVAAIGRRVAEAEGMDPDVLEIACLLHDVGKFDAQWHVDHGRAGAEIVEPFLGTLGMPESDIAQVCQGIAMHTDGRWNYPEESPLHAREPLFTHEPTVLSRSVGDCDNIDRFSLYRIYDTLTYKNFDALELPRQLDFIDGYLQRIARERQYMCATRSAQRLWIEALERHESFFSHLREQLGSALPYLQVAPKQD